MPLHQFLPQAPDVHVHGALVAVKVITPDSLEQGFPRHCDADVIGQRTQQLIFSRLQSNVHTVDAHLPSRLIYFEAPEVKQLRPAIVFEARAP